MSSLFSNEIARLATIDIFKRDASGTLATGVFDGRPFPLDYNRAFLLVADAGKMKANGYSGTGRRKEPANTQGIT